MTVPPQGEAWPRPEAFDAQKGAMLAWMQEVAPYGIFTTDAELRIRSWNQWLVTHSGLAVESVLGRPLLELFPDVQARRLDECFRRATKGEISMLSTALHKYLLPLPVVGRGYAVPHMLQTVRIAPLPLGQLVVGTITTIEDVTQRECQAVILQRQQEYDRLHSAALALLLQSHDARRATAALFPRIAVPLKLEAYLNYLLSPDGSELRLHAAGGIPADARRARATLRLGEGPCGRCAQDRHSVVIRDVQANADETVEPIRRLGLRCYAVFPLLIGDRLLGTVGFGSYERDVIVADELEFLSTIAQYLAVAIERALRENALLQARQGLSEHAEILELKVAERTARLHETIAQLESFSYTVAHDLRAPIRALKTYSEILLQDYAAAVPPEGLDLLRRLQRAGNRLDALTRDLLKFSKIAGEEVQLAPIDVAELVHDIVVMTPALQNDVLTVRRPLGKVWAQDTLLHQCLSNLLDNALKFTAPTVTPRIVVWSELRTQKSSSGDNAGNTPPFQASVTNSGASREPLPPATALENARRVRIWIEDNGVGIPPEAHQKVFGIFERGSGLGHVEGTGIGLAIVARATQQMGGNCGVESTPGEGSRFWVELAAAPTDDSGVASPE